MSSFSNLPLLDGPAIPQAVASSPLLVLDFGADWCAPCKRMAPILDEVSKKMQGKVRFAAIDADKNDDARSRYGVMGLPTMVFLKDGKVVDRLVGFATKDKIEERLAASFGVTA